MNLGKLYVAPPRGDCGHRHDFSTEAAMYLYHDRVLFLEFLEERRYGDDNILENAIYTMLSSVEIIGEIRARAMIHDKIIAPLRFFSGCKGLAWGPLDMNPVCNVLEKFLRLLAENGSLLMDESLDVFSAFNDQEAYLQWKEALDEEKVTLIRAPTRSSLALAARSAGGSEAAAPSPRADGTGGSASRDSQATSARAASGGSIDGTSAGAPRSARASAPAQAPAATLAATSASSSGAPPPTAATESASSEAAASAPAAASRVAWRPIVRRELYAPSDETNKQTDVTTIESIESWAAAMLIGMEESTIKDYLDSQTGKYSEAHADAATKKHLASGDGESIERVNDLSESTFGVVDHYYHLFPNQHVITAAGVAQCIINHDMDIHYVNSRARKPTEMRKTKASAPAKDGAFTVAMQSASGASLLELSRKHLAFDMRAEQKRLDAQHLYFREVEANKKAKKLASLKNTFKLACLAFEVTRATSHADLTTALRDCRSDGARLTFLRNQVRHYVYGRGLTDAPFGPKVRFSDKNDAAIGTIDELTARVKKMITTAEPLELPEEPPLPALTLRVAPTLGTATKQRAALESATAAHIASYKESWMCEITEEIAKRRSTRSARSRASPLQPTTAPAASELVGQRVEVLFSCKLPVPGKRKQSKAVLLWCAGDVVAACDESTVVNGRPLDNTYVQIRYDLPQDAEEGDEREEEYRQLRKTWFGARKTKAGSWRIAQALTNAFNTDDLSADDLSELDDADSVADGAADGAADDAADDAADGHSSDDDDSESEDDDDNEDAGAAADASASSRRRRRK